MRRVEREVIPEIDRLASSEPESRSLYGSPADVRRYAPDDSRTRAPKGGADFNLTTEPEGAEVAIRNYLNVDGQWEPLGQTPFRDVRLPARLLPRSYREGGLSIRSKWRAHSMRPALDRTDVRASGGSRGWFLCRVVHSPSASPEPWALPDFWIDKLEVTNSDFKRFRRCWRLPRIEDTGKNRSREGDRVLAFDEASPTLSRCDGPNRPGDLGAWHLSGGAGQISRSAESAGSKRPRMPSSPARAFRRCITGIGAAAPDESVVGASCA